MDAMLPIVIATIGAGTAIAFAALGEVVTEKSGVLNLGVEGMMLVGAIAAFAAAAGSGSLWTGVAAGMLAGAAMALLFAFLTLTLMANQVACGLALSIFGVGLSAYAGQAYLNIVLPTQPVLPLPGLSALPVLGPMLFAHQPLVYASWGLLGAVWWFLARSRAGLRLRSVGESPQSAHALGLPVTPIRYLATLFGGAMAGVGGAFLAVMYTPMWVEGMTAGRGWIALALVVFGTWRPGRIMLGAYLFGGITVAQLFAQSRGIAVPSQLLSMLPYLATVVVLVIISSNPLRIRLNTPASLGQPFRAAS
ncbi:ABC transporter permease [Variovorax saccharolyticus]|uniref:ABC transporter permease n=1 Tax=Variovorax saccharolyticus TaxID=3053516 RepID=UPI0025753EDB|nr:ABC transporter permease [Variovorax sp. J22R187]MDM0022836.1 ABC transporter permease [Variovorax sp. J22R187]